MLDNFDSNGRTVSTEIFIATILDYQLRNKKQILINNEDINKYIEEQIYLDPDNILKIKKCNEEFDLSLYQDIISVGEYKLD